MRTVRMRLTLLYSGLFVVTGAVLVGLVYLLVAYSPFPGPAGPPPVTGPSGLRVPELAAPPIDRERAESLRRLLVSSVAAWALMAAVSVVLGWVLAGRVLRPLGVMTATVRQISADRLGRRLAATGPDDELKALSDTFDDLLARVEAAFAAQRRFVADASHELRTPLALARTIAEVALADPEADAAALRTTLGRLLDVGREQQRLLDALLILARGHAGLRVTHDLDLATITRDVVARCLVPAPAARLRISRRLETAPISGDPDLVERLATNLVDNALRHNVADGWVSVVTTTRGDRSTLRVANSGPVVPADQVDRLLRPFQRGGPGRPANGEGLGLGLSIVAAIVDAHRGSLHVAPLPDGGLEVTAGFAQDGRAGAGGAGHATATHAGLPTGGTTG